MHKWLFLVPLLLASACTTVEDFQAMSPDERADKVCSATSGSRQRRSGLMNLDTEISAQQNLLATGYRVYQNCQVLPVRVSASVADCSGLTGSELKSCQKSGTLDRTEYRRVCRETRVPLDYNYESGILRNLRMAREDQLDYHNRQTEVCVAKARLLPATDAYSRYQINAEP